MTTEETRTGLEPLTFEDFPPGARFELGSHRVEAEEILGFAAAHDPQPFHIDEQTAARTPFGGLIASGWHTASIFMKLYVDTLLARSAGAGSPGVDELRWLHPVRPGDVLTGTLTVLEARALVSRPDLGLVVPLCEAVNQDGVTVLRMKLLSLFLRRAALGPSES